MCNNNASSSRNKARPMAAASKYIVAAAVCKPYNYFGLEYYVDFAALKRALFHHECIILSRKRVR